MLLLILLLLFIIFKKGKEKKESHSVNVYGYVYTYIYGDTGLSIYTYARYVYNQGKGNLESKVHLAATYGYFHPTRTQLKGEKTVSPRTVL